MTERSLAVREATSLVNRGFDDEQLALLKRTLSDIRPALTTDELTLYQQVIQYTGLNPFNREIYAIRIDGRFTILTGIDGHRRIAQASPRFRGLAGPEWCGPDGKWTDVWLQTAAPAACRVGVYLPGRHEPTWGVAYFKNYRTKTTPTWKSMPEHMLAIRAEAFALRKCFSRELGGVALPDDDDRPAYVDADGVIDEQHPDRPEPHVGLSPRMQAIKEETDAAVAQGEGEAIDPEVALARDVAIAEADAAIARVEEQHATPFDQEQPPAGPRWAGSALGRQVSALVDALNAAGKRFSLPDDDASPEELKGWLASKKTVLGQRT